MQPTNVSYGGCSLPFEKRHMSDDGVRLHVEASVVSFSSSLVFFGNYVQNMCTAPPTI